jgi:hypothetical protein
MADEARQAAEPGWFSDYRFVIQTASGTDCALGRMNYERAPFPALQFFLPLLFACNRHCAGVNRQLKWLVQGGSYRTMTPPCLDS